MDEGSQKEAERHKDIGGGKVECTQIKKTNYHRKMAFFREASKAQVT